MEHKVQSYFPQNIFPVWLRKRLISAGLEPVLSHTEKIMYRIVLQINFTNIKINILKLRLFGFQI